MKHSILTYCFAAFVLMAGTAQAASLAPSLQEFEASRGEVVEASVKVINTEAAEQIYYMGTLKFKASDEASSPEFIPYDEDHKGLPEWISFPVMEIRVPARSSVDVPFKITVPLDAVSGGHYAAVTVSSAPSEIVATNGAIVESKTASLVLLSVKGETRISAVLVDFTSKMFGNVVSSFNGTYQYRVQNQGNVHIQPQGTIRFTDVLGRNLLTVDANEAQSRVLPASTRTFLVEIRDRRALFALGPMKAELRLGYGGGADLVEVQTLWLFSFSMGAAILVLMGFIAVAYKRLRRS